MCDVDWAVDCVLMTTTAVYRDHILVLASGNERIKFILCLYPKLEPGTHVVLLVETVESAEELQQELTNTLANKHWLVSLIVAVPSVASDVQRSVKPFESYHTTH